MSDVKAQVGLDELVGMRMLDGRGEFVDKSTDRYTEDAAVVVLRLDGEMYWFQEDPGDGYRSGLNWARRCSADELPGGSFVEFPARLVSCAVRTKPDGQDDDVRYPQVDEVLVGTDEATGTVLFEIGTANTDDYYPYFVHAWHPPETPPRRVLEEQR